MHNPKIESGGAKPGLEASGPAARLPLGLRTIALFEGAKGALAAAAGAGLLSLRHTDLHAAADALLLRHHFDPEQHYTRLFIESVANATHRHVGEVVAICLVYSLIRFVEGYGLWRGKHWAEWFAVISAGLYLPLEVQHFAHRATPVNACIIFFNLLIIVYLARLLRQQRAERRKAHSPPPN
jgi:uncharacterized membrane protein (DUF2068 family)